MSPTVLIRIMAVICVALALICGGLAVAYGRLVERTHCIETWANYGLAPPAGKCPT